MGPYPILPVFDPATVTNTGGELTYQPRRPPFVNDAWPQGSLWPLATKLRVLPPKSIISPFTSVGFYHKMHRQCPHHRNINNRNSYP